MPPDLNCEWIDKRIQESTWRELPTADEDIAALLTYTRAALALEDVVADHLMGCNVSNHTERFGDAWAELLKASKKLRSRMAEAWPTAVIGGRDA